MRPVGRLVYIDESDISLLGRAQPVVPDYAPRRVLSV